MPQKSDSMVLVEINLCNLCLIHMCLHMDLNALSVFALSWLPSVPEDLIPTLDSTVVCVLRSRLGTCTIPRGSGRGVLDTNVSYQTLLLGPYWPMFGSSPQRWGPLRRGD